MAASCRHFFVPVADCHVYCRRNPRALIWRQLPATFQAHVTGRLKALIASTNNGRPTILRLPESMSLCAARYPEWCRGVEADVAKSSLHHHARDFLSREPLL